MDIEDASVVPLNRAELWYSLTSSIANERRSVVATAVFIGSRKDPPPSFTHTAAYPMPLIEYWYYPMRSPAMMVLPVDARHCVLRGTTSGAQITIAYKGVTHLHIDAMQTMVELVCRGESVSTSHPLSHGNPYHIMPEETHHSIYSLMEEEDGPQAWRYFRFHCDPLWITDVSSATAPHQSPAATLYQALRPHVMLLRGGGGEAIMSPLRRFASPPRPTSSRLTQQQRHQQFRGATDHYDSIIDEDDDDNEEKKNWMALSEWQRWLMVRMNCTRLDIYAREGLRPSIAEVLGGYGTERPSEVEEAEVFDWIRSVTVGGGDGGGCLHREAEKEEDVEIAYGPTLSC